MSEGTSCSFTLSDPAGNESEYTITANTASRGMELLNDLVPGEYTAVLSSVERIFSEFPYGSKDCIHLKLECSIMPKTDSDKSYFTLSVRSIAPGAKTVNSVKLEEPVRCLDLRPM